MEIPQPATDHLPPVYDVLYLSAKQTAVETMGGIYCSTCHDTFKDKKEFDAHYLIHNPDPKETVYTCIACYKQIKGYPTFRSHCYNTHTSKYKHKCPQCPKTFSKEQNLRDHQKSMHTDHFKCDHTGPPMCTKKFSSLEHLKLHKQMEHPTTGPPYPCVTCARPVNTPADGERHAEEHARFTYTCPICSENLGEKQFVRDHLITHYGDEQTDSDDDEETEEGKPEDSAVDLLGGIQCYVCDEALKNRPEFDSHFKFNHPDAEVLYSCTLCVKQYDEYSQLGRHYYDHLMKDRFSCATCGRAFGRLSRLVQHAGGCALHPGTSRLYACALCPVRLSSARRLAEHARATHGEQVLRCPHHPCQAQFSKPGGLAYHEASAHTRSDKWCRRCGLALPSLTAAARHMEVHREAAYSCAACGRPYTKKAKLLKHLPQHFQTVLHVCKICGKVYNARNRLVAHSKTHSDTQALECTYCGKRFATQYKYKQHLNIHTGARPYKCTVCPKTFTNQPNCIKHLRKMHNVNPKKMKLDASVTNIETPSPDFMDINEDFPETLEEDHTELDNIEPTVLDVVDEVFQAELGEAALTALTPPPTQYDIPPAQHDIPPTQHDFRNHEMKQNVLEMPMQPVALMYNAVTCVYEDQAGVSDSPPEDYNTLATFAPYSPPEGPLFTPEEDTLPHINPLLTHKEFTDALTPFDSFEHSIALAILAHSGDGCLM